MGIVVVASPYFLPIESRAFNITVFVWTRLTCSHLKAWSCLFQTELSHVICVTFLKPPSFMWFWNHFFEPGLFQVRNCVLCILLLAEIHNLYFKYLHYNRVKRNHWVFKSPDARISHRTEMRDITSVYNISLSLYRSNYSSWPFPVRFWQTRRASFNVCMITISC